MLARLGDSAARTVVRSGGHNITGTASLSSAVCLDLRRLAAIEVDARRRRVLVGGGASWAQFDAATTPWGLATTGGTFDTTGVTGLTIGGGIGHLMAALGLACDRLLAARVVTTAGEVLVLDDQEWPEAMWAMRGAGHGLGVVTQMEFLLEPVSLVVGGVAVFGENSLEAGLACFARLAFEADNGVTTTCLMEGYGARTEPSVVISICSPVASGHARERDRLAQIVASYGGLIDTLKPMPYLEVQRMLGRLPYGQRHYWSARTVERLDDHHWEALLDRFADSRLDGGFNDTILIEALGGAVVTPPLGVPSSVPFRGAAFNVTGMAIWLDPASDQEQQRWARSVPAAVAEVAQTHDGYVNYQSELENATPENHGDPRLEAVRKRLDPAGILVPPARVKVPKGHP
jgi:FAD/FMN-containing dehydrogenase